MGPDGLGKSLLVCAACKAARQRQGGSATCTASIGDGCATCQPTQHVSGVDLQYQPAVAILFVGAKDGEYGALLAGLGQQAVHKHWLLGESECLPGLPFVCAVPGERRLGKLPGLGAAHHRAHSQPQPEHHPLLPCHLLELVGLCALCNGHKNATVVTPGVIVGSR